MTAGFRLSPDVVVRASSRFTVRDDVNFTGFGASPPWRPPPSPQHGGGSYFSRSFNSNVVVVMAVLLFALVVAAFINTVARCILRHRRLQPPEEHATTDKGLDKSVIEALPMVAYGTESSVKALFDPAGGNECVVCLTEFVHGERLRVLPDCHHGFHVACIDTWLLTHTSCPVCRRIVFPSTPAPGSDDSDDPACRSIIGSSARFGSSRFGSARIASVDIEIESLGSNSITRGSISNARGFHSNASGSNSIINGSNSTDPSASSSNGSASRPGKRAFAAILSSEAMATIIHGVGPRRFGNVGRSESQV